MNDFFTHQAIQKNIKATDELNKHLSDLKVLTNGDLAKQASEDLKKCWEEIDEEVKKVCNGIIFNTNDLNRKTTDLTSTLQITLTTVDRLFFQLRRLIFWGWVLLSSFAIFGTGVLCYVAYRAH